VCVAEAVPEPVESDSALLKRQVEDALGPTSQELDAGDRRTADQFVDQLAGDDPSLFDAR